MKLATQGYCSARSSSKLLEPSGEDSSGPAERSMEVELVETRAGEVELVEQESTDGATVVMFSAAEVVVPIETLVDTVLAFFSGDTLGKLWAEGALGEGRRNDFTCKKGDTSGDCITSKSPEFEATEAEVETVEPVS